MNKNRILAFSTVIALLLTTSSCGSAASSTTSTAAETSAVSSGAVSTEASSVITPTGATAASVPFSASASGTSAEPTAAPTLAFVPNNNLDDLLDKVTNYEEGTAGSSLKQAKIAGELLDWVEDSSLTQKDIEAQIAYYLKSEGTSALVDQFTLHLSDLSKTVLLIISKDSNALSNLTDAGYTPSHSQYTQSKWNTFQAAAQLEIDAY